MKNIYLILLLLFSVLTLHSQDYLLSFTASGASSEVGTVEIENLTTGTTLTVSGQDILRLGAPGVGVNTLRAGNKDIFVYPNPVEDGNAKIEFTSSVSGKISVEVYDITGRIIVYQSHDAIAGKHTFLLSDLNKGLYAVRINTQEEYFTGTVIFLKENQGQPQLRFFGSAPESQMNSKLKSAQETVIMTYAEGDLLLLKGISGNYSRIVTMVATGNAQVNFEFVACTDGDGNHYPVVTIDNVTWMAENLKTTKYNDQTPIDLVTDETAWGALTTPAYCYYLNDDSYKNIYGALYNWAAANTGKLCPTGWHVSTLTDYNSLITGTTTVKSTAGGELKSKRTDPAEHPRWNSPNKAATNSVGFTSLPGGHRVWNGTFSQVGQKHFMWTTDVDESNNAKAWYFNTYYEEGWLGLFPLSKLYGMSIRCVKNVSE